MSSERAVIFSTTNRHWPRNPAVFWGIPGVGCVTVGKLGQTGSAGPSSWPSIELRIIPATNQSEVADHSPPFPTASHGGTCASIPADERDGSRDADGWGGWVGSYLLFQPSFWAKALYALSLSRKDDSDSSIPRYSATIYNGST
jgi:hypothetical protein